MTLQFNHFAVEEVRPGIFLYKFKEQYEMCMHFLRYQEFYESPSSKIRGKHFTIFEFMKWYSTAFGKGSFTYTRDWGGFNLNSSVFEEVRAGTTDHNIYDGQMMLAHDLIAVARNYEPFYVIGALGADRSTIRHEIAHGFYSLNPQYRKDMNALVAALPKRTITAMHQWLKAVGYTPKVFKDEIQAYFATGIPGGIKYNFDIRDREKFDLKYVKPFKNTFNKYYKIK